ncbi:hypothetical protein T4E_2088 [Trichinella pseudospiralis]|uniref:Uncharacterized protein n=1 Tax=Trichinella pseudospiralis TaxID=6337 RepID=A0A0V0XTF7_TRIPS|nr:hypothetical protein T4E_2088 [Trichinella pseudospiralis]
MVRFSSTGTGTTNMKTRMVKRGRRMNLSVTVEDEASARNTARAHCGGSSSAQLTPIRPPLKVALAIHTPSTSPRTPPVSKRRARV